VSTLEDKLRDAFRANADTVRPESIQAFDGMPARRVAGRTRLFTAAAAAVAVVAITVGVWGTSSLLHGQAHGSGGGNPSSGHRARDRGLATGPLPVPLLGPQAPRAVAASAPAHGVPPFYVTPEPANVPHASDLVIQSSASGKIVGAVVPPRRKFFASVAAVGDETFVTALIPINGQPCVNTLYQFRLSSSGQPGPLAALHITVPGNFNETNTLAVTPTGRIIAYATYICDTGTEEYGVIDLATRSVRIWTGPGLDSLPAGLSLSADGRLLAFADVGGPARILSTGAAGGSILSHSRILSRDSFWVALAGDGSAFYGCTFSPRSPSQRARLTYFWQAVGNSQRHVIATWPNVSGPQCMASPDSSGHALLVQFPAGSDVRPVILNLRSGRTTSIPAPAYYGPATIAW
jgi:hypothetical protein